MRGVSPDDMLALAPVGPLLELPGLPILDLFGRIDMDPIAWPGNDVLRCAQHRALDAQFQTPRPRGEPEPNELRAV